METCHWETRLSLGAGCCAPSGPAVPRANQICCLCSRSDAVWHTNWWGFFCMWKGRISHDWPHLIWQLSSFKLDLGRSLQATFLWFCGAGFFEGALSGTEADDNEKGRGSGAGIPSLLYGWRRKVYICSHGMCGITECLWGSPLAAHTDSD